MREDNLFAGGFGPIPRIKEWSAKASKAAEQAPMKNRKFPVFMKLITIPAAPSRL